MVMLDAVGQRQLAMALYGGVWAIKAHFIVSPLLFTSSNTSGSGAGNRIISSSHILIWTMLDITYLLLLRLCNVPRLRFSLLMNGVLALSLFCINAGIIGGIHSMYDVVKVTSDNEQSPIWLGGDKVAVPDSSNASHIIGSHVVHVLPPTVAKLNPDSSNFCLSDEASSGINVPLVIKGTPPYKIDYELVRFDGTVTRYNEIGINSAAGDSGRKTRNFSIPAPEPGLYRLLNIYESNGDEGKVIKSFAMVVPCPEVKWLIADDVLGRTIDKCMDDLHKFSMSVYGSPPLQVTYNRKVGKDALQVQINTQSNVDELENQQSASTLLAAIANLDLTAELRQSLVASRPQAFTVESDIRLEVAGPHFFRFVSVTDGRNNTIAYGRDGGSDSIKPDQFIVDAHSPPVARFRSCDSLKLKVNAPGQESVVKLPVQLDGSGPWDLVLTRHESEDDMLVPDVVYDTFGVNNWESRDLEIPVSNPGYYSIKSVSDAFCSGRVDLPTSCLVQRTLPPTITVAAEPIEQSCVGAIGALVNVSLTGDPPFWIEYDEIFKNTRTRRTIQINKLRDTLSFTPSVPGTYVYEFKTVGDMTYRSGISIENVSITQIIHPQSEARFDRTDRMIKCIGDKADLGIQLTGSGPWTIAYEVVFGSQKNVFVQKNVESSFLSVSTPPLENPGTYIVDMINITDANGCSWPLDSPGVSIEVLPQRPSAAFVCPKPVTMLDGGSAFLPVSLQGRQPFALNYTFNGANIYSIDNVRMQDKIQVNAPGSYVVVGLRDAYCAGHISERTECQVVTIPRPKLEIPAKEYSSVKDGILERNAICEGVEDSFELLIHGKAPFSVRYALEQHTLGSGAKTLAREESFAGINGRIRLETMEPGTNIYRFSGASDGNYKHVHANPDAPLVLKQTVLARPTAVFEGKSRTKFLCVGDEDSGETIIITFGGVPPFSLVLELKPEGQAREVIRLTNITQNPYPFKPPVLSTTGAYNVQLVHVQDSTGCDRQFDREVPDNALKVKVSDVAKITAISSSIACVGDILTYTLQGTAPFFVTYEFNNVTDTIKVVDPLLTLHATSPGVVKIAKVCNQMQCCTRPENIVHTIYDLPGAVVDGGYDMVEDIREGDEATIAIEFKGTPPFSFTYSRQSLDKNGKTSNGEAFTVGNIESNHFMITTHQEGLFMVTAVYDKYCSFPRVSQGQSSANALLSKK